MSKLGTRHSTENKVTYDDFTAGLNLSKSPNQIDMNEFSRAENVEYDYLNGSIRKAAGLISVFDAGIPVESFFLMTAYSALFSSRGYLYSTNFSTMTQLGALTGSARPMYYKFGDAVIIASGGKLQKYENSTLTTIDGSKTSNMIFVKSGRVITGSVTSDTLSYSAVGDAANWEDQPSIDSSGKELAIGYKDAGNITAMGTLSDDLIIFKDNGHVYRVSGDYPDWKVKEISRVGYCSNKDSVLQANNLLYFLGNDGIHAIKTVQEYGDMTIEDIGTKINSYIQENIDPTNCAIWHIPTQKQIWIQSQRSGVVFILHTNTGAFTTRRFAEAVNDVRFFNSHVYVARGNKILEISPDIATDDGVNFNGIITLKTIDTGNNLLLKRTNIDTYNLLASEATLVIGKWVVPIGVNVTDDIAYLDDDIAAIDSDPVISTLYSQVDRRGVMRAKSLKPVITVTSGSLSLRRLTMNIVEVL